MKRIIDKGTFVSLLLLLFVTICSAQFKQKTMNGKAVRIKDGDTFVFQDSVGVNYDIRVAGIDCPEKKQEYGDFATAYTTIQILNKDVKVQIIDKDLYQRNIAYVFYNVEKQKKNLSYELIRNGLAWHFKQYSKDRRNYLTGLENKARKDSIGLWINPNSIQPWIFRKKKF